MTAKQSQAARKQLVAKLHKALKGQYKPAVTNTTRSVLEQVMFACCLENAHHDAAEKAFARLLESYFDLNEIRVTTVAELAETLHGLPDPARSALALRRVLQSVFESTYSFSLDHAKKHSIAHGVRTLEQLHGIPPFVVQHVAATALGAHLVPVDLGALSALYLTGIAAQEEYDAGRIAGLEKFIAKKAGLEFGSLLHQFGADVVGSLHGAAVKKVLQAVNADATRQRFPKRGEPLAAPNPPPPAAGKEARKGTAAAQAAAEDHRPAGPQAAARPAGKTPLPPPGSGPKRSGDGTVKPGGKPGPKPFVVKPNVGKPVAAKPPAAAPVVESKPPAGGKAAASPPPKAVKKPTGSETAGKKRPPQLAKPAAGGKRKPVKSGGKRHSVQLAKRKPR